MLNNRIMKEKPSDEEMNTRLKALQKKLAAQTLAVREHKLPVIVLVEGWVLPAKAVWSDGSSTISIHVFTGLHRWKRSEKRTGGNHFFGDL